MCMRELCQHICAYWSLWCEWKDIWLICVCVCVAGCWARWLMPPQTWTTRKPSASSTTTTDQLAQGSGRQSVPVLSCLNAPESRPWQVRSLIHVFTLYRHRSHFCNSFKSFMSFKQRQLFFTSSYLWCKADSFIFSQMNEMQCRRRLLPSGLTPICPECPVAYLTFTMTWGMDTCSPDYSRSSVESCWWEHTHRHPVVNYNWLYISFVVSLSPLSDVKFLWCFLQPPWMSIDFCKIRFVT